MDLQSTVIHRVVVCQLRVCGVVPYRVLQCHVLVSHARCSTGSLPY